MTKFNTINYSTSPSLYLSFEWSVVSDDCGALGSTGLVTSKLVPFGTDELLTYDGFYHPHIASLTTGGGPVLQQFNIGDLPCPPPYVMVCSAPLFFF